VETLLEEVLRDAQGARAPVPLTAEVLGELPLKFVELEVEVLGGSELGGRSAERAFRASELTRLEGAAAAVALVAAGALEAAVRAGPDEVPVRQEAAVLRAVGPLGRPPGNEPRLEEVEEQLLDGPLVDEGVRARDRSNENPSRSNASLLTAW